MAPEPISVLIVDEDFYACEAMRIYLSRDVRTRVSAVASSVEDALTELDKLGARLRPAIVVVDAGVTSQSAEGDGIARLRAAAPNARLIVMIETDEVAAAGTFALGADGYLGKNESAQGIANAVVAVAQGRFVVTRSMAEHMLSRPSSSVGSPAYVMREQDPFDEMSEPVRSTIYLFCFCGMSKEEIADELKVSVNTVASRIKTAYEALGPSVTNRSEAFQALIERGFEDRR